MRMVASYHGYLLAAILTVWGVIIIYMSGTWLRERRHLAGIARRGRESAGDATGDSD